LKHTASANWLHVALDVRNPPREGLGLYGSGVFVLNPPWTLRDALDEAMPWLVETLAVDQGAGFALESGDAARE
jgi:23S rRNA (adenine2030-N6)-methyltransferase